MIASLLHVHAETNTDAKALAEAIAAQVEQPSFLGRISNVKPNGNISKDVLPMLQKEIDKMSEKGGGRIVVWPGVYYLCGPLVMKSNVELHLKANAILKFSGAARHFLPVVRTRWEGTDLMGRSAMIYANGAENIAITGVGIIDGRAGREMSAWGMKPETEEFEENVHGTHGETLEMPDVMRLRQMGDDGVPVEQRVFADSTKLRPCMVEFFNCKKVLVEGITVKNSPFWCIHPVYSENVTVRNVTIDSYFPNNDGCDPESSRNVLIENCNFYCGDDAVAIKSGRDADGRKVGIPSENIVIRNCEFRSKCNGLCIGSEMSGGVKNVVMYNVKIGRVKNALLFKSNLDRGGYIKDVVVDSIDISSASGALLRFETNYFGYRGGNYPAQYENFRISNVKAGDADAYAIYFDGPGVAKDGEVSGKNTDYAIRNVTVENFTARYALHTWYLYNTDNCRFINCKVGERVVPESPKENPNRVSCDVW